MFPINTLESNMGVSMKSLKNHLSLVIALFTILFTIQTFVIVNKAITAYENELKSDYSIVVVSMKSMNLEQFQKLDATISNSTPIEPDSVLEKLEKDLKKKDLELIKLTLPKFYKLELSIYPTPDQVKEISQHIQKNSSVKRVVDFAKSHDKVYKLLLLFKSVTLVFGLSIFAVTSLLILKEMRIWQFKHNERMAIMALFGAPVWLRSAVLFRLAIVDALISSALVSVSFLSLSADGWINTELANIGIKIEVFSILSDGAMLFSIASILSIALASMIVLGHKEEV